MTLDAHPSPSRAGQREANQAKRRKRAERAKQRALREEKEERRETGRMQAEALLHTAFTPELDATVAKASLKPRHKGLLWSFLLTVVTPILCAALYLYTAAADQYASRTAFSVRKQEMNSAVEILGGFTQLSGSSTNDADVINSYITSQELVETLATTVDLRDRFATTHATDPVFSLSPTATIEDLVRYWNRALHVSYSNSEGIIALELTAFTPEDAQIILEQVIVQSTDLINEINRSAREDQIRFAREELDKSVARLREARIAMSEFRSTNRLIDPSADIQGQMGVINSLEQELASTMIELDLISVKDGSTSPRTEQFRRKIKAIEARIADERTNMASPDQAGLARVVGMYEGLLIDTEFATEAYKSSLAAYDAALAEAQRQNRYLAIHVHPTRAESAEYPRRVLILSLAGAFLLLLWVLGVLVAYAVRDRG
ncbi:hypothetical protein [Celeribacter litoreus]|uniref:hypothetical protein n=1 Tax=Celeribacter litoreus TaxID=2876714 RepID=UPI001CCDC441|nr:hypothetical protein [Celeribacter litoreus]MCA0042072.1 hypothetical protein [Celeribacter litoreus]